MVLMAPDRAQVSPRVALLAPGAPDECLAGVRRFAEEHGWQLSTDVDRGGKWPQGWNGDGVLVALPDRAGLLPQVAAADVPCVAFSTEFATASVPLVTPDEVAIGRLAADYLIERGFRAFAFAPLSARTINAGRLSAFRERLTERGYSYRVLPPILDRVRERGDDDSGDRRRIFVGQLRQLAPRTAIFAHDDRVAAGLVECIREAGLLIPEDIAVLGVGNSASFAEAKVPVSMVELDLEHLGYQAAAMLQERMRGALALASGVVPPKGVVTRVSTETDAVSDERVVRALAYIEESFTDPNLSVDAVAWAVGMSRRNLERSFRHETGRTIYEHIVNVRMREAAKLLAESPAMRALDVARKVGLSGERTFYRVFRRYFGKTPKAHGAWTSRVRNVSTLVASSPAPMRHPIPQEESPVPIGSAASCPAA